MLLYFIFALPMGTGYHTNYDQNLFSCRHQPGDFWTGDASRSECVPGKSARCPRLQGVSSWSSCCGSQEIRGVDFCLCRVFLLLIPVSLMHACFCGLLAYPSTLIGTQRSLQESIGNPTFFESDIMKCCDWMVQHLAFQAVDTFVVNHGS